MGVDKIGENIHNDNYVLKDSYANVSGKILKLVLQSSIIPCRNISGCQDHFTVSAGTY